MRFGRFSQSWMHRQAGGAETLLAQYKLEDVTVSLMQKYSSIPPGWGERASAAVTVRQPSSIPYFKNLYSYVDTGHDQE
jgi:hypothetical protein